MIWQGKFRNSWKPGQSDRMGIQESASCKKSPDPGLFARHVGINRGISIFASAFAH